MFLLGKHSVMKILIVYFSRTGHTRRLADRLARELGATTAHITEARSRRGLLGYQRSLYEAVVGSEPQIMPLSRQPSDYDLVLIGTPIWGWHLSSPVRSFARQHAKAIRRTAFFCTMGGSGDRRAFAELARLLGRKPEAVLAITEAELKAMASAETKAKIQSFVRRLPREAAMRMAA